MVFGGKEFGMVRLEGKLGLMLLLRAKSVETFDGGATVGTIDPLARCPPCELSTGWFLGERFARINQGLDVHTIIDRFVGRHG
jgi:hypothetical protein